MIRSCLLGACIILAACSGSSKQKDVVSDGMVLSGSVGDGPIVGAEIRVFDADGTLVLEGTSDESAGYRLDIPDGTALPLTITASGGIDLVTGRPADFELRSLALNSGLVTVNVTPYTTLAADGANCRRAASGEDYATALSRSWAGIDGTLNFGWDRSLQNDPLSDSINGSNVAMALLSNEALGELARRTTNSLSGGGSQVTADQVMQSLACDVADGRLDGAGPGVDARIAATAIGVGVGIQLEVLAGALDVDGQDSMGRLDEALQVVVPGSDQSVGTVEVVAAQLDQLRSSVRALDAVFPDDDLNDLLMSFADVTPQRARNQARSSRAGPVNRSVNLIIDRLAAAPDEEIAAVTQSVTLVAAAVPPVLSFSADTSSIQAGQSTRLSWAAGNADRCVAAGSWSGERATEGVLQTGSLTQDAVYRLTCLGLGGEITQSVAISVREPGTPVPDPEPIPTPVPTPTPTPVPTPAPTPTPVVTLGASASSITAGQSTMLTWNATNASTCNASGGWSGARATSGSLSVSPTANASYTLTCSGAGGSANRTVSVSVTAPPPPPPPPPPTPAPVVTLGVSPNSIASGQSTTLTWNATNASTCNASGSWSGTRATSGSLSVSPTANASYALTCSGAGGSVTRTASVSVTAPPTPAPLVTLGASPSAITAGQSTMLNWSSTNASSCSASGSWSGSRATNGSLSVSPTSNASYTLTCSGAGGSVNRTVAVSVTPAAAPQLTFSSADSTVSTGGTTQLTWSSTNTTSCTASGGWSGGRSVSGSQMVGPLSGTTTFTLSCSGPGGNVIRMLTVSMMGQVTLNWMAPTQNVDGTALMDLAGYRIHYGTTSRNYTDSVPVSNPTTTSRSLSLISGDYYFAMTALDQQGEESAYSNEVRMTAQ